MSDNMDAPACDKHDLIDCRECLAELDEVIAAGDLVLLDSEDIERCACGQPATWTFDPATMAPHPTVTERTPYCAKHGPNTPPVEDAEPDAPPSYVEMNLQGDWIATVPFEVKTMVGSIHLAHAEKSPFSRVIAVGPGEYIDDEERAPANRRKPMFAKPGDKVLLAGYAGVDLTHDDIDYRLVRDADVVATFPEGEDG